MRDTILFFRLYCAQRCIVSGSVNVGLRRCVGTLCHVPIMTSHCDVICDVTRHVHQGYKTASRRIVGDTLVQLLLGKEVHMHAWIDALACPRWESLLSSNITDRVVLIRPCASAFIDAPITLREWPGNAVFFLRSTASTRTIMPFGWCPCALFIELLFTSPEA